jgi:hypothetical protein
LISDQRSFWNGISLALTVQHYSDEEKKHDDVSSRGRGNRKARGDIFGQSVTSQMVLNCNTELPSTKSLNDCHGDSLAVVVDDRVELVELAMFQFYTDRLRGQLIVD